MLFNLAWKNIWRNKVRSGVILTAIALGLFAGTFLVSFMTGYIVDSANTDIKNHLSHFQIHNPAFMANNDINAFLEREAVESILQNSGLASETKATYRLSINGIMASAGNISVVSLKAVDVEEEKAVSSIWECIPDTMGAFLPDGSRLPAIVISRKLAEHLRVRLTQKIVFSFTGSEGEMQSIAFRVGGIYKTTNAVLDENKVFVRRADIIGATGLPGNAVHEVAIRVKDLETSDMLYPQLQALFPSLNVMDWRALSPMFALSFQMLDFVAYVYMTIFLLGLAFGIINTMLMAVLERTHEIGMLGAIGMGKKKIYRMIMTETVLLTGFGSIIGVILATLVIYPLTTSGLDLSASIGDSFEEFGMGSMVYPILTVRMYIQIFFLVALTGILSAIYPAKKALKLKPLEAIREV